MTDITELAKSLKAAAENAIGAHERLAAYPYGEIIDISQHEGDQIDIDITDMNEFNKEANPVNILALVEALEKAQGMEAYWKTQCRGITDHCEELQARIAELESQLKAAENNEIDARCHIADLESRTVKLPKPHAHLIWIQAGHAPDDYWDDVAVSHSEKDLCCDGSERYPVYARWEIEEMLAAAGIKVEAE